jgi:hypothetical protein
MAIALHHGEATSQRGLSMTPRFEALDPSQLHTVTGAGDPAQGGKALDVRFNRAIYDGVIGAAQGALSGAAGGALVGALGGGPIGALPGAAWGALAGGAIGGFTNFFGALKR